MSDPTPASHQAPGSHSTCEKVAVKLSKQGRADDKHSQEHELHIMETLQRLPAYSEQGPGLSLVTQFFLSDSLCVKANFSHGVWVGAHVTVQYLSATEICKLIC